MNKSILLAVVLLLGIQICFVTSAKAALSLYIDTNSQYFWLTGSDIGITGSDTRLSWSLGNSASYQISGTNLNAVTLSTGSVTELRIGSVNSTGSTLAIWTSVASQSDTITGAGFSQQV